MRMNMNSNTPCRTPAPAPPTCHNRFLSSDTVVALGSTGRHHPVSQCPARSCKRFCRASNDSEVHLHVSEPYRGPNSPVSGYRLWLPGGGLVHVQATVDPSTVVEAAAVVQEGAQVGKKCQIGSGSIVGPGVIIGDKTRIDHQVSLQHCSIGSHCVLQSGVKVGVRGFVFRPSDDGGLQQPKERQTFRAEIRDNVEVGANSVIDRGSWRDTTVDKGARLDSLVHIGHDSSVGRSCMLCSSASLGASSSLGDDVILGHRAAVKDHIVIASRTRVAAKSGVVRDITEVGDYAGHPAVPAEDFKQQVAFGRPGKQGQKAPQKGSHQPPADQFSTVT